MKRGLAILIVALLLAGCGNTSGGLEPSYRWYGTHMARYGGTIFFVEDKALFTMNLDGSRRSKIADDCAEIINVTADHVFYTYKGTLYRSGWDGAGCAALAEDVCRATAGTNRWLYFIDFSDNTLVRLSKDGSIRESISSDGTHVVETGDNAVILKGPSGYSVLHDGEPAPQQLPITVDEKSGVFLCLYKDLLCFGTKDKLVLYNISNNTYRTLPVSLPFQIQADDGHVYYVGAPGVLHSVKTDGTGDTALSEVSASHSRIFAGYAAYAVKDGWVYFSDKNQCLWRVRADGKGAAQLTETSVGDVLVTDTGIYYFNCNYSWDMDTGSIVYEHPPRLYSMGFDGSGKQSVELGDRGILHTDTVAIGRFVYIQRSGDRKAYKCHLNGQGLEELDYDKTRNFIYQQDKSQNKLEEDTIAALGIEGRIIGMEAGWVYYMPDSSSIRRVNGDTGKDECVIELEYTINDSAISDGWIYISYVRYSVGRLCRVKPETGEMQLLSKEYANDIKFDDDYMYYISSGDLYRIGKSDLKRECIVRGHVSDYRIEGNDIYCITGWDQWVEVIKAP